MPIVIPGRFCFLFHPRTASRATSAALKQVRGAGRVGDHHAGLTAIDLDSLTGSEILVATIRDPVDLVAAWFRYAGPRVGANSLEHFLDIYTGDRLFARGGRLFYHATICQRLLRFDRVAFDLACLGIEHDLRIPPIEWIGEDRAPPPQPSKAEAALIRARFPVDVGLWERAKRAPAGGFRNF